MTDGVAVVALESLAKLPHVIYQEYAGDFESACRDYHAKFHTLPPVVYQHGHRYFFPIGVNKEVE